MFTNIKFDKQNKCKHLNSFVQTSDLYGENAYTGIELGK